MTDQKKTRFMADVDEAVALFRQHARRADNRYLKLIDECAQRRLENDALKELLVEILWPEDETQNHYVQLDAIGVVDTRPHFTPEEIAILESLKPEGR